MPFLQLATTKLTSALVSSRALAVSSGLLFAWVAIRPWSWLLARRDVPLASDHDVAWFLQGAARLLHGGSIPQDVFDPNPPLVFWIHMPIVALAEALSIEPLWLMDVATMLLITATGLLVYACLRALWQWPPEHAFAAASVLLFSCVHYGNRAGFGQRDQLIVLLLLPYILSTAYQSGGGMLSRPLRASIATAAAVGIALRPHYGLVWLLCEVYRMGYRVERPSLNRYLESAVVVAVGVLYVAAVVIISPGWIEMLRTTASAYGAYRSEFVWWTPTAQLVVAGLSLAAVLRLQDRDMHLVRITALAGAAMYLAAAYQSKNWFYHQLPAAVTAASSIALALLAAVSQPGPWRSLIARLAPLAVTGYFAYQTTTFVHEHIMQVRSQGTPFVRQLAEVYRRHAHGKSVFVMSTSLPPTFPGVNVAHVQSASRFSCLWLAPGLYRGVTAQRDFPYRPPSRWSEAERYFVRAVVEDLQRYQPDVIIHDTDRFKQAFGYTGFDFLEYFDQAPEFRRYFADFRRQGAVSETFHVYVRGATDPGD